MLEKEREENNFPMDNLAFEAAAAGAVAPCARERGPGSSRSVANKHCLTSLRRGRKKGKEAARMPHE